MRVLFAGGGTAGHLAPCIAVAQTLALRDAETAAHFAISSRPADGAMLAHRGLSGHRICGSGMPYGCSPTAAVSFVRLAAGGCQALRLLARLRPDVVLATGGYVSAAVVPAARILGIPIVLLAADVMPDRTNRFLSRWATTVAVVSASAAEFFGSARTVITGMPVRPEILATTPTDARASMGIAPEAAVLLVTGGSQGAQRLNDATFEAVPQLLADPAFVVIHLTGVGKLPPASLTADLPADRYIVSERREDMGTCLAAADIVLTRAGANGVAEAAAWGRPMIIVPYPHAGGHQRLNAEVYADAGAAVIIDDAELTAEALVATVGGLMADRGRLGQMGEAALQSGSAGAAGHIADILGKLARSQGSEDG